MFPQLDGFLDAIKWLARPISVGCYAFRSRQNGKYVTCQSDSGGIIMASGVDVVDPHGRFFVEPQANGDSALVHIRCSYNNKYWVCRKVNDEWCIYADAHEPEEDQSKDGCTLFECRLAPLDINNDYERDNIYGMAPSRGGSENKIVITAGGSHPLGGRLLVGSFDTEIDSSNSFVGINLDSQVVLSPRVCFRGDNGIYICVPSTDESDTLVQFKSIDGNDYSSAMHTINIYGDGTIRIQSEAVKKYWRRGIVREEGWSSASDGIWADSDGSNKHDPDVSFQVLKLGDKIALKNLGNNRYCKSLTIDDEGKQLNILGASDEAITDEALLQLVVEPLLYREVHVLEYHLQDARVYDKKTVELECKSSGGGSQSNKLHLRFDLTQENKWTSTVTEKEPVRTVIKAKVPFIDSDGQLQLGKNDIIETIIWGESISHTLPKWEDYIANSSSATGTERKLQATATQCRYDVPFSYSPQCRYDVPFSYSQEDTFIDGENYTIVYHDGLYSGVNCYDIKFGHV